MMTTALFTVATLAALAPSSSAEDARARLAPLTFGSAPVGYRVLAIEDPARARRMTLHVWYPAERCESPMTFGDYLATDPSVAPDDEHLHSAGTAPMIACRGAGARPGPHPLLIGRGAAGTWPLQAEYLASHGYLIVMVASRGSRIGGSPEDLRRQIALQLDEQTRDLAFALTHATANLDADATKVGVLAASDAALLFAMTSSGIQAISLQDSGVFAEGLSADAVRLSSSWQPARMRAPLLYLVSADSASRETKLADFEAMGSGTRQRVVLDIPGPASHEDLASIGFLRLGQDDSARRRAFTRALEVQHAFFDRYVRRARGEAPLVRHGRAPARRHGRTGHPFVMATRAKSTYARVL